MILSTFYESESLQQYYCRQANDFTNRLYRHNSCQSQFTSSGIPWIDIKKIEVLNRSEAIQLEKKSKSVVLPVFKRPAARTVVYHAWAWFHDKKQYKQMVFLFLTIHFLFFSIAISVCRLSLYCSVFKFHQDCSLCLFLFLVGFT